MATQAGTFAATQRLATNRKEDSGFVDGEGFGEERGAEEGDEGGVAVKIEAGKSFDRPVFSNHQGAYF